MEKKESAHQYLGRTLSREEVKKMEEKALKLAQEEAEFKDGPVYSIPYSDQEPKEPSPLGAIQVPELTPQDQGEPSPVPYSIFINSPVPTEQRPGDKIVDIKLAVAFRTDVKGFVPPEVEEFINMAFVAFEAGYYRFELVVGGWSIRVYKHPNNP